MKKYIITKEEILNANENIKAKKTILPKYVSPFLNQVNTWARSTRPETVGALATDIFPDFVLSQKDISLESWKEYYIKNHKEKYIDAQNKLKSKFLEVKEVINHIDDKDLEAWIDNLLFYDTYAGLYVQDVILNDLSKKLSSQLIPPTAEQEGQGVDGYINGVAYSVKPLTYKSSALSKIEKINAIMIYYEKNLNDINYYVEE
jgi:hypothetical protein